MNFVILSNQKFDQELKTNKWRTANVLATTGHKVFFVDPPLRLKGLKSLFKRSLTQFSNLVIFKPIRLSLFKDVTKTFPLFDYLFTRYIAYQINKRYRGNFVLWVYHMAFPNLELLLKFIKPSITVYDMVDEYAEFPEFINIKTWINHREKWLITKANICFTSAPGLFEKAKELNLNSFYTPNAGDYEFFSVDPKIVIDDIKEIKRPIVGFAGALDDFKIDINLIEKCAKELKDVSFVLIGPKKVSANAQFDSSHLDILANVYFLGAKNYSMMPAYLYSFDAFFIPSVLNDYNLKGCFPMKFFDALSAGLPVTVTNLPAYADFKDYCNIGYDYDDFVNKLKLSLTQNSREEKEKRKQIAQENSHKNKVKKQLEIISNFLNNGQ